MKYSDVLSSKDELQKSLKRRDIDSFKNVLKNYNRNDPAKQLNLDNCLGIACREPKTQQFILELLKVGANQNKLQPPELKAPIHLAAHAHNEEALEVLLQDPRTEVNKLDHCGRTALHLVIGGKSDNHNKAISCLRLLLARDDLIVNIPSNRGKTAIFMAAENGYSEMVELLLNRDQIDLDSDTDVNGITARQMILRKFPKLEERLRNCTYKDEDASSHNLFKIIRKEDFDTLKERLDRSGLSEEDLKLLLNSNDGTHTFMQSACSRGLVHFVKEMVGRGADPNKITDADDTLPSAYAAAGGFYDILGILLEIDNTTFAYGEGYTVLHAVITESKWKRDEENLKTCFNIIMKNKHIPINSTDKDGNTALHIADKNSDQYFITELIKHGASIAIRNHAGELPLQNITSNTLDQVLNHQMKVTKCNDKDDRENTDRGIIFDYSILSPPSSHQKPSSSDESICVDIPASENVVSDIHTQERKIVVGSIPEYKNLVSHTPESQVLENDPLLYISKRQDLRHSLKHPIITVFLGFKWSGVKIFFFFNVIFYLAFVLCLTIYITYVYQYSPLISSNVRSFNESDKEECKETNYYGEMTEPTTGALSNVVANIVWFLLLILWACLLLRELVQIAMQPKTYLSSFENYIEIAIIIMTSPVIFYEGGSQEMRSHLSAVTIFLPWTALFLLTGRYPSIATNVEMLKKVAMTSISFLIWYSVIIIGFSISFYILFRRSECSINFSSPGSAMFKTLVMITGEFEVGDIPFAVFPGTSHALFLLFVFIVAIVMLNLLNAMAIGDTQAIIDDAELVATISQVNFVSFTERILHGKLFWKVQSSRCSSCLHCCNVLSTLLSYLISRVTLFPKLCPQNKVIIRESDLKVFKVSESSEQPLEKIIPTITVDSNFLKQSLNIIKNNKEAREQLEGEQKQMEEKQKQWKQEHKRWEELKSELTTELKNEFTSHINTLKAELILIISESRK